MSVNVIVSDDTLTLWGRVMVDLADGDTVQVTFPDKLAESKTGKNKNTIFAEDQKGNNAVLTVRFIRGSSDDQFMQAKLAAQKSDFPAFELAYGSFKKRMGDGDGNIITDSYTLSAGVFTKNIEGKENVEGNIDQAVSIYEMKFARAERTIG